MKTAATRNNYINTLWEFIHDMEEAAGAEQHVLGDLCTEERMDAVKSAMHFFIEDLGGSHDVEDMDAPFKGAPPVGALESWRTAIADLLSADEVLTGNAVDTDGFLYPNVSKALTEMDAWVNEARPKTSADFFQWAAMFYTSGDFPDNWDDLESHERAQWCADNPHQTFEGWDGVYIMEEVEVLATAFANVANRG